MTVQLRRYLIIGLTVSAVMFSFEAYGKVPFEQKVVDNNGPQNPWAKIVGDFGDDGNIDIVIGGRTGPLVLYTYPSWTKSVIADGGYKTVDGEAGDMDGDGDLDIVMGGVVWYENPLPDADPVTKKWTMHTIADHPTHDVELADLDKDGILDIVTRNQSEFNYNEGNTIHVWLRESDGSCNEHVINCPHGEGITLTDIDDDGDRDIIIGGIWYENTEDISKGIWPSHDFASFHKNATVMTADIDNDGDHDVVLTPSELKDQFYDISWFENPGKADSGNWREHKIDTDVECVYHSLDLADVNGDGYIDILTAEMHQGVDPDEVSVYLNISSGKSWDKQVVSTKGSHYIRAADIGSDGDIDVIGANHGGEYQVIELWENHLSDGNPSLNLWSYIEVDGNRAKWGDWAEPEWCKYFGLAMGDATGDGFKDIASGRYFYCNPGGDMTSAWKRVDFGSNVDAVLFVDIDSDEYGDIIAEALPDIYWLEAGDKQGNSWRTRKITEIPKTGHGNGQGYTTAQILKGGKPEILLASGDGIYCIEIPGNPETGGWKTTRIAAEATEEGIGVGDIDDDGDLDIAAGSGEKNKDGMGVNWWENPGNDSGDWRMHEVGMTIRFADRFAVADLNSDGLIDIVVTEERWPEPEDAHVFWFEQKKTAGNRWVRHTISTQNTSNNLDIADMDGDGDIDIITAEHRGTEKVQIFENNGSASAWIQHVVSSGKESHLGARVADMDNDGDIDIVSIAWDDYRYLHLWRNDSLSGSIGNSKGVFFREYWAEWDKKVSNHPGRLRVNDINVSLDEKWGKRNEALANGLMLVNVPEYLFHLESAELYLELWGGHPHTENKRFIINGKKWYHIPKTGTENGHCTYSYPVIPLNVGHLVNGMNAFQFTCERGAGFWGHYIIDNAAVRCYIPSDHPDIIAHGLKDFSAQIKLPGDNRTIMNRTRLFLSYDDCFEKSILSVEYFGRFLGFDDNGNTIDDDWHGFTFDREFVNHIGGTKEPPFEVLWDTIMIPGQGSTMAIKALVRLTGGINYWTPIVNGLVFPGNRSGVMMFKCSTMPVPFWSRASHEKKAIIRLPDRLDNIAGAQLLVKVWDGGEGTVKEPFKINGFPYSIVSGKHIHDVVFTRVDIMQEHLKSGDNELTLLSDTEHHGIEMLFPGPCFIIRYK